METKKKLGLASAIAIALAGGAWTLNLALDFSTTTITGDTITTITTELGIPEGALETACADGLIPEKYSFICDDG